jgi:hypothetical protein
VKVEAFAVEIARRFADFEEFLDFGVVNVEIHRRRAAPQRALGDRQGERIHHPDEGNDAGRLAVLTDFLADRAHAAPIGADAAAIGREPDILGPGGDDVAQRIVHRVQEARDRQAAISAAIGQHRRRRHEPQIGHVVIKALRMLKVVGVGRRNAREHVLVGFAGQQVAINQRLLAEIGQKRVARGVDLNLINQSELNSFGLAAQAGSGLLCASSGSVGLVERRHLYPLQFSIAHLTCERSFSRALLKKNLYMVCGFPRKPQHIVLGSCQTVNGSNRPRAAFFVNKVLPENAPGPDSLRSPGPGINAVSCGYLARAPMPLLAVGLTQRQKFGITALRRHVNGDRMLGCEPVDIVGAARFGARA